MPRFFCCCLQRTCFYVITAWFFLFWSAVAIIACSIFFNVGLPARRAHYLEHEYLRTLHREELSAQMNDVLYDIFNGTMPRYRKRVLPLIKDVAQLHYWRANINTSPTDAAFGGSWSKLYNELLGLNFDGTGVEACKDQEFWIYIGGTPASNSTSKDTSTPGIEEEDETVFKHRYKRQSCIDPEYICDSHNSAFDRISERWHGVPGSATARRTSEASLMFVDCDISTFMCDSNFFGLGADPTLLLHLKIGSDCEYSMLIDRCPVTWRFIGLPISRMPWSRQIRIPLDRGGSTVVPAFPDAEEQMWSLMAQAGAEEGLEYGEPGESFNNIVTVKPVDGEAPYYSYPLGLHNWDGFRSFWDNPWELEEWPREYLIKCYITYYTDRFLKWWDGEPVVVYPRSCENVEKDREDQWKLRDVWYRIQNETRQKSEDFMKRLEEAGHKGDEYIDEEADYDDEE